MQYFQSCKVPQSAGNNNPEHEEEEIEEKDERRALLPVEHFQVKENGSEAEEDPYAPLNQILHVSSYNTNAVGHVSRQITFYQHINGLRCLMGRLVSEFAKQSITLIMFRDNESTVKYLQVQKRVWHGSNLEKR